MTTSRRSELEPLGLLVSSLVRKAWLILPVTALVGAGTYLATGLRSDDDTARTAVSRVGITTEAVWPFYDVVLEQGRIFIDEPEFQTRLEDELGFTVTDIRTVIPDKLSVFDVEVVADTPEQAITAADLAARQVVEQDVALLNQDRTERLAAIDAAMADLESRIADLRSSIAEQTAQIEQITAQQAQLEEFDPVLEETKYPISTARDTNQFVLNDLERELAAKVSERSIEAATAEATSRFQVLRLAEVVDEGSNAARLPVAIGAAVAALLLTAAAAVALDRRRGPVRSAWQLRNVCGAERAGELSARGGRLAGAGALADELVRALDREQRVIGIVDLSGRKVPLQAVIATLAENGLAAAMSDQPQLERGTHLTLVDVSDEFHDDDTPRPRSHSCDGVVLLVDGRTDVRRATGVIRRLESSPGLITALLVTSR